MHRTHSDCLPLTTPKEDEDRFLNILKYGEGNPPPGDMGESTIGVNPDPYPDLDRAKDNADAPWGENNNSPQDHGSAQQHSNAVLEEFRRGREEFLNRYFDSKKTSQEADHKLLKEQLNVAGSGEFEGRRPMLRELSKRNPEPVETLLDKTKKALDTY